jgi:parvulin-like peptidyl-prolyl isomerase
MICYSKSLAVLLKNISIYLIIFLLSWFDNNSAQQKNEILAKIGNQILTTEEFLYRFEFTPHPINNDRISSDTKRDFLLTLLAEKILADEAIKKGYMNSDDFKGVMSFLNGIYLRDALYKIEIKDKIIIPEELMKRSLVYSSKKIKMKFIFSESKEEIDSIYSLLINGNEFDSLLFKRSESKEQIDIKEVTFGDLHPLIEEQLFSLLPGMITKPIQLIEGWYICKVVDLQKIPVDSKIQQKVNNILSDRIEDELYQLFYRRFFKEIRVNADREIFTKLSQSFQNYINKLESVRNENSITKYYFGEPEIRSIELLMSQDLQKPFIKFDTDSLVLKDFLNDLKYGGITFISDQPEDINKNLSSRVSYFIRNQLFVQEAKKRGYDSLPEVQKELKIWRDYYLSHLLMKQIFVSTEIDDKDALEFYNKENQVVQLPDTVKIAQIKTDDLNIIEEVLKRIEREEKFIDLCKEFKAKDPTNSFEPVSEFFPINEKGEIGRISGQLKENEIFGPFKQGTEFIIIQLLEKKIGKKQRIELFEEAKEEIKNVLKTRKMFAVLDTITSSAASSNNMNIDFELLNNLKTTNVNMMIFRRFGFGGQLIAVPYSIPYKSWYELFLKKIKKELP